MGGIFFLDFRFQRCHPGLDPGSIRLLISTVSPLEAGGRSAVFMDSLLKAGVTKRFIFYPLTCHRYVNSVAVTDLWDGRSVGAGFEPARGQVFVSLGRRTCLYDY